MAPRPDTKERILDAALDLFNERGLRNVALQDVARACGMSPGNLAYHYPNREALLAALHERMAEDIAARMADVRAQPSFANADRHLRAFLAFQDAYRFYFLDAVEILRAHPELGRALRERVAQQRQAIRATVDDAVAAGSMAPPDDPDGLADRIWQVLHFAPATARLHGHSPDRAGEDALRAVWSLLEPHLTPDGRRRFAARDASITP
jgi:AcrR family transcriptional regulator